MVSRAFTSPAAPAPTAHPDSKEMAELKAQNATLQAQNTALHAQNAALQTQNAAMITHIMRMAAAALPDQAPKPMDSPPPYTPETSPVSNDMAELKAQNAKLLAMLEHMVMATPTPATPTPPAAPPADVPRVNVFGQETVAHVTDGRILAILSESLRTSATVPCAAKMAVRLTATLIYGDSDHPENQTSYWLEGMGGLLTHTDRGWQFACPSTVVAHIGQRAVDTLTAVKLPPDHAGFYGSLLRYLRDSRRPDANAFAEIMPNLWVRRPYRATITPDRGIALEIQPA